MKKKKILSLSYDLFFCLLVFGMTAPVYGQQLMRFQFDEFQEVNFATSASAQEINLPSKAFVLKIQNLNSLSHMGNRLNVHGNMLLIEDWATTPDGRIRLTLRREDGRDFFNLFPTVTATIEPVGRETSK